MTPSRPWRLLAQQHKTTNCSCHGMERNQHRTRTSTHRLNAPATASAENRTGHINSRGVGWECVHLCIDDSRIAYAEIRKDERKANAVTILKAAVACCAKLGIRAEGIMADNGSCYKSRALVRACRRQGSNTCEPDPTLPKPMVRPSA